MSLNDSLSNVERSPNSDYAELSDIDSKEKPDDSQIHYEVPDVVRSRLDLSKAPYPKILESFIAKMDFEMTKITLAVDRKDTKALRDSAEWLKGAAGSLGLDLIADAALDIETFAKSSEFSKIQTALNAITLMRERIDQHKEESPPIVEPIDARAS